MASDSFALSPELKRFNAKLDHCALEARRNRLALRALLPDPSNPGERKRQRLNLPVVVNLTTLPRIKKLAAALDEELDTGTFHWKRWTPEAISRQLQGEIDGLSMEQLRQAIQDTWVLKYPDVEQAWHSVWGKKWAPLLRRLETLSGHCNEARLEAVLQAMAPSARKDAASILSQVIKLQRLELDVSVLREAGRGYSSKELQIRDIPSDAELLSYVDKIRQPHWRWMYGVLLTYGIRPHEIAHCQLRDDGVLEISAGKTGARESWACPQEWIEQLQLHRVCPPRQSAATVAKAAADALSSSRSDGHGGHRKPVLPFGLYTLRHAYAIRLLHYGIAADVGARLMGHSVEVHHRTYRRWVNKRHMDELRLRLEPQLRASAVQLPPAPETG